jgi:hypothetical protein
MLEVMSVVLGRSCVVVVEGVTEVRKVVVMEVGWCLC